jgi:hypothetical protein
MLREVAPARLAAAGGVQVVMNPPRELAMAALRRLVRGLIRPGYGPRIRI